MRTENLRTRDILMAGFILPNKDTIHVFVNHWPSRRGGVTASEPKRMAAAEIITAKIDSLREMNPNIQLVVMGDFNDTPVNNSMQYLAEQGNLMNLMSKLPKNEGSHKYQGVWDYLDQLLVSPELLKQSSKSVVRNQSAYVFNYPYLLEQDDRYGDYFPLRTWKGNAFINGFSDHLPVFIDIIYAP
jgi:predicted extracellular nuclease